MADRIKLRRGPKNNIDLNVYELGYVTDSNEERLYFNNGSMVPIPNNKDITDIKTELTETTNVTNKNKQDVLELKESVAGIIKTGVAKLVQYSYDIELSENTKKINIPYERYSSVTDTLKVYVNGLAIQNDQYTITDPVENVGIVTNGYIVLKVERPAGTIVRIEVWKNVPSGEEGGVSGNIITKNSLPLDRIIGINDITSNISQLSNTNLLINGDFQVWQRGNTINCTSGVQYTADRWALLCGNNGSIFENKLWYADWTSTGNDNLIQIIEMPFRNIGLNLVFSIHMNIPEGKQVNVRIGSSQTGSITNDSDFIYDEAIFVGTGEFKDYKLTINREKNNSQYCKVVLKTEITGKISIAFVKLEIGTNATKFVPRPYGEELDLCQRYYENGYSNMIAVNTHFLNGYIKLVPKRVTPTVKIYSSTNHTLNKVSDFLNGTEIATNVSNVRVSDEHDGLNGIHAIGTDNGGLSTGTSYSFSWTADAEIY